jgi:hypothetical protein
MTAKRTVVTPVADEIAFSRPTVRSCVTVGERPPPDEAPDRDANDEPQYVAGLLVVLLRRIPDERGTIFHMLRLTEEHFVRFGDIYFTTINREVVKGWHKQPEMTLNYACIVGRIKLALYDDREDSPMKAALPDLPPPRQPRARRPRRRLEPFRGNERPARDRRELLQAPARPVADNVPRSSRQRHPLRLGDQAPLIERSA